VGGNQGRNEMRGRELGGALRVCDTEGKGWQKLLTKRKRQSREKVSSKRRAGE